MNGSSPNKQRERRRADPKSPQAPRGACSTSHGASGGTSTATSTVRPRDGGKYGERTKDCGEDIECEHMSKMRRANFYSYLFVSSFGSYRFFSFPFHFLSSSYDFFFSFFLFFYCLRNYRLDKKHMPCIHAENKVDASNPRKIKSHVPGAFPIAEPRHLRL